MLLQQTQPGMSTFCSSTNIWEALAQKEAKVGGERGSAAASVDEKADDAVDYSDEEEMAEDESAPAPQASNAPAMFPGCVICMCDVA